jgi:hypothetical protein
MTEAGPIQYKSRRGGLIFFGLLELALGGMCLLVLALTAVSMAMVAAHPVGVPAQLSPSQMMSSMSLYLFGGALLICLGIGSLLCRRWARDLSLVVAWVWLLSGLATGAALVFLLPRVLAMMPPSGQPDVTTVVYTCLSVLLGLFGITVPLSMILFYRSPHVRATCRALDPRPRWTERAPLPLLGLSLWLTFSAVCMMTLTAYAVFPFGGRFLTGPAAVIVWCAIGAVLFYVAWGVFALRIEAWWAGMAYGALATVYCVVVFPSLDYNAMLKAMNLPKTPYSPDLTAIYRSPLFVAWMVAFGLIYFGYFLFVYRYFRPVAKAPSIP